MTSKELVNDLERQLENAKQMEIVEAARLKPPATLEYDKKDAFGHIVLMRQGWSTTLRTDWDLSQFPGHIEIIDYQGKHFNLNISMPDDGHRRHARITRNHLATVDAAKQVVRDIFGSGYQFAEFVKVYCFPGGDDVAVYSASSQMMQTTASDKYLLEYAVREDSIVSALRPDDETYLVFTDGLNYSLTENAPPRMEEVLGARSGEPPTSWFHDCDTVKGMAYCRDRFCWLLNAYSLEDYQRRGMNREPLAVAGSVNVARWKASE